MWILCAGWAAAATWTVGSGKDFETLAAAIEDAASGDELLVDPGTWSEALELDGKDLDIRSVDGADATTISAPSGDVAVRWAEGESGTLEGFTLQADGARCVEIIGGDPTLSDLVLAGCGTTSLDGGAIRISGGSPELSAVRVDAAQGGRGGAMWVGGGAVVAIDDVTLVDPEASWGAGIYVTNGSLVGEGLRIEGPSVAFDGGGLFVDRGSVDLVGLEIIDPVGDETSGAGVALRAGSELVVDGGEITGATTSAGDGGAVHVDASSDVELRDVLISGNTADDGGAIGTLGGSLVLQDVTFDGNTATVRGGAIRAAGGARIDTASCTFVGNEAPRGGAVALTGNARLSDDGGSYTANLASVDGGAIHADGAALLAFEVSVLERNEAGDDGGAIYAVSVSGGISLTGAELDDNLAEDGDGGGLWVGSSTAVTLADTLATRNRAGGSGGALAAVPVSSPGAISLRESTLRSNQAERGGGALFLDGTDEVDVEDCHASGNTTEGDGGALLISDAPGPSVLRTWFHANIAEDRGGAVLEDQTTSPGDYRSCSFTENEADRGGALALRNAAEAAVVNATFAGNGASVEGGHVHVAGGTFRLVNVIAALATDGGGVWGDSTAAGGSDWYYSLAWQNSGGHLVGALGAPPAASGNLEADPKLRAISLDGSSSNDDLRLGIGSPAIDAGDPSLTDVDGSRSDIGAWGGPSGFLIDDDGDGSYAHADCADDDGGRYPGADEVPYDGVDQDCDGEDATDLDDDGFDGGPEGDDCNDDDPAVFPGAFDVWYDGIDADCAEDDDYDQDGDGFPIQVFGGTDCDDEDIDVYPGAIETWYDGVDQDCSGGSDFDQDGDAHDAVIGGGDDCHDLDAAIHPGASEICDRVDNDCDGDVDGGAIDAVELWIDADGDGYGDPGLATVGCFADAGLAPNPLDCDDTRADVHPAAIEVWYDGIDDDCDGRDDDRDLDGHPVATDCDDDRPEAYPGAEEVRNGLDDDCDGFAESADRDAWTGRPKRSARATSTPPRAEPSSLVTTRPVISTSSLKVSTWAWAFWPVVASRTSRQSWGAVSSSFLRTRTTFCSSAISSERLCRRPAVSISRMSSPSRRAVSKAS